ncbi:MAG: Ig-like domain-containing protein [Myxococcales bacterium]|nr:Ig-like domain-containing protein [Myxococcales bacterium]
MARPVQLVLALSLALWGCEDVDYVEIRPQNLVLKQRNNEIWLQGRAMSQTGVHYSRTNIGWNTKDPSIATVDEKGRLRPVASGLTWVVATANRKVSEAPVEVLFAEKLSVEPTSLVLVDGGPSVELKVKVFDYKGRELRDRTATFRSTNKEVVSMGQNAAFPLGPGTAQVEVMVEEQKQLVSVTVEPERAAAGMKK